MILYRIENAERLGPWRSSETNAMSDWCEECGLNRWMHNNFPTPSECNIGERFNYISCFADLSHIDLWFPYRLREIMAREGFSLNVYDIPDSRVTLGEQQAAVVGDSLCAEPIDRLDLVTLQPLEQAA